MNTRMRTPSKDSIFISSTRNYGPSLLKSNKTSLRTGNSAVSSGGPEFKRLVKSSHGRFPGLCPG